ncbi:MAG: class I SAM-dependent methyltransferase [Candidatus Parcubacteria bacterium]|nr:class I SAM-dependent methyltransferase [Candidatus Parcubacteria bacterium]
MNKLFTKYLDLYDQLYYGSQVLYKKEVAEIIKFFPKKVENILDIGCGTGKHALELFKLGYSVDCIDISPLAVKTAKENLKKYRADIKLQNIVNYKSVKKYDAVLALFMVLSYLQKESDFTKALRNIYKSLNKHAVLIFDVVNGWQLENNFEPKLKVSGRGIKAIWSRKLVPQKQLLITSALITKGKNIYNEEENFRYYFPGQLKDILKQAGFKKVKIFIDYNGRKRYNTKRTKLCVVCYK